MAQGPTKAAALNCTSVPDTPVVCLCDRGRSGALHTAETAESRSREVLVCEAYSPEGGLRFWNPSMAVPPQGHISSVTHRNNPSPPAALRAKSKQAPNLPVSVQSSAEQVRRALIRGAPLSAANGAAGPVNGAFHVPKGRRRCRAARDGTGRRCVFAPAR